MRSGGTARSRLQQLALVLQPHNSSSGSAVEQVSLVAALLPGACAPAQHASQQCYSSSSSSSSAGTNHSSKKGGWSTAGAAGGAALLTAAAAAAAAAASSRRADDVDAAMPQGIEQQQQHWQQQQQQAPPLWLPHILSARCMQRFSAAAEPAPHQQQQQQRTAWASGPGGPGGQSSEPLSGAIAMLDEDGLTNHPLDYNPITNEHTAAMTLAKQAGLDAYQAGRYAEAERRFKQALVEARAGFPLTTPHIPSALHYLAEFYRNVGRLDEAEPLYRETIQQLHDTLGERHWMYSAALCSLAGLHEARGEYTQAIQLLETALELRRQLFSNSSFPYADTAALLAKTLMQQHKAATAAAGAAGSSSSSSSGGGWFGGKRGGNDAAAAPADVLRAIGLWQKAIQIVEDSGSVAHSPIIAWLLDLASAQQVAGQFSAAVASLQKALEYMALPQQEQEQQQQQSDSSIQQQQQQQQQQGASLPAADSSSSSSSAGVQQVEGAADTLTAVMAASGGDVQLARLKLGAMASEVAERLVDAQLAAGDLEGARHTLRQALEARIALLGKHLVVAKTMTRLANLLMQPPSDPSAPQLAPHLASSAVAIADSALQTAQRSSLWRGMVRGALKAVQSASFGGYKAGLEAERTTSRLLAALQLGNASLALAAAENMKGRPVEAESALRHGVAELRWVLGVSGSDLDRLSSSAVEGAVLQRVGGLMVDLKLLQMDCLEALAASLREQAAAGGGGAAAGSKKKGSKKAAAAARAGGEPAEVVGLLAEADRLAAELVDDD